MKKREIGRLFPILIALFLLTSLASAFLVFFLWKTPDNQQFEESFLAAEVAAAENQRFLSNRALIRASRHAISVKHWKQILGLSAQKLPMAPTTRDYRLFVKLAGRAASGVAGNQDFAAYLVWGELRSGKIRRAEKALDGLSLSAWPSLQAEVRIAAYLSDNDQSLEDFYLELESKSDAEFFEQVAELTRSAALTVDAALAYMEIGQPAKALELSQEALSGNRWWGNPRTPYYRGIFTGLSRIAYDAADTGTAVTWLEMGLADARERRAVFWEDLQFLGDIFWEKHRTQARADYLIKARELWYEALDTVYPESSASPPEDSWKIWLSLSVLEGSAGSNRQSEELLRDALILFPDRSEVKAAWARKHADTNPGLARRLGPKRRGPGSRSCFGDCRHAGRSKVRIAPSVRSKTLAAL